MAKEQIIAKRIGLNLIVMIDNEKYVKVIKTEADKKTEEQIKNKILLFNKRNSKTLKEKIIKFFETKLKVEKIKNETELKGLKKLAKKETKKAQVETKTKEKSKASDKIIEKIYAATEKVGAKINKDQAKLVVKSKDGGLALKGYEHISMPDLLVNRIQEYLNAAHSISSLLNFWSLCLLNPNEIARTKLFDYLSRQKLLITPSGYFVTYRMVKKTDEKNVFTDAHTKKMRYTPGSVCAIPRSECDEDGSRDCSRGLHTGTPLFIGIDTAKEHLKIRSEEKFEEGKGGVGDGYGFGKKFVTTKAQNPQSYGTGYDSPNVQTEQKFDNQFGNQAIICLINPQHVVSIPNSDTRKMRSCEFYFAKLTTPEEVIGLELLDYYDIDLDYRKLEFKQIQEMLKDKEVKAYFDSDTETGKKINELRKKIEQRQDELKLSGDGINIDLNLIQLKTLINNRTILLKKKK